MDNKILDTTSQEQLNSYERGLLSNAIYGFGNKKAVEDKTGLSKNTLYAARDNSRDMSYGTLVTLRKFLRENETSITDKSAA